jgi:hypothetical protein
VLAILGILDGIEASEVVHKGHRAVARRPAGRELLDRRVQVDDAVLRRLGPPLGVKGQQVGEDDVHLGVLSAHLGDQGVVRLDNVAGGLLADQDVVGANQHEHNVRRVLIEPDGQVAIDSKVCRLGTGVAFVILVDVGPAACALLRADEVEVCDLVGAELGLKICAPTSLEGC